MLSTWSLLLAGDLNLRGQAVLHEAWLIAAGGLVQTMVALAAWPLRPFAAERHAVGDAYRALAAYARAPTTAALQSTSTALAAATETVGADSAQTGGRGALRTLVEQGEWVRLELAALARSHVPGVDATLRAAADALDNVLPRRESTPSLEALNRSAQRIDEPVARQRAARLTAWIAAAGAHSRVDAPGAEAPTHPARALRDELTLRSSAFRHAIRLSVALMVAVSAYRSLSLGSGYWVPLTVLFVLRPDYGTTITRGIGRTMGTMVGVTIAWTIVTLFSPSDAAIVILLTLLAGAAYAVYLANYALFSVVLVVLVALLVEFSGGSPIGALIDRLVDTAIGAAIALGAFTLWPTREAPDTHKRLAAFVIAQGRWLAAILNAYSDGGDRRLLRPTRLAARRARVEAWDSVRRALAEPPRRRPDARPLRAVLTAMDDVSEAALVPSRSSPRRRASAARSVRSVRHRTERQLRRDRRLYPRRYLGESSAAAQRDARTQGRRSDARDRRGRSNERTGLARSARAGHGASLSQPTQNNHRLPVGIDHWPRLQPVFALRRQGPVRRSRETRSPPGHGASARSRPSSMIARSASICRRCFGRVPSRAE